MEELKKLLDFDVYSEKFIKIINKDTQKVSFVMNNIQRQIDNKIKEIEAKGKPVRLIILKPRQPGVSTYVQAKYLHKTATAFNKTALVVAHTDKSTNAIFNKTKFMYDNLPAIIKPLRKASNAQELIFDKPSTDKSDGFGLNSRFKIATAGGSGIGRSDTHHYVHLSELAFYEGDTKQIFIGIMQSVPKTKDSCVIIESTAQGFNYFKEMWDKACNGESEFVPLFFSWFDHEEYQMPVTEDERLRIMSNLNEYEKMLIELFNLPAERIKWYRWSLENDCQGDTYLMKQENPSTPEEAFLHTGRPVFDLAKVQKQIERLRNRYKAKPFEIGDLEYADGRVKFIPNPYGVVKIYKHPEQNKPYVIGSDTAAGLKDGDYSTASVGDNVTCEQMAAIKIHMEPEPFGFELFKLAKYYNNALLCIEVQEDGHGYTTVKEVQKLGYFNQYKRANIDKIHEDKQQTFGWKNTSTTRPVVIDRIRAVVRESPETINDLDTLLDMTTFIYKDSGKPEHETGCHDDTIFAFALQHEARSQQRAYSAPEPEKWDNTKYTHPSMLIDSTKNPQLKRYYQKKYG
ncbi:MAG: hypothetical protein WC365_09370, partial [Candidatus Babeliales bacterium]